MSNFVVASLVWGATQSTLEHYRDNGLKSARTQNLYDEYGRIITWLLLFTYPNALDVVEQVERHVLGADDENATIFKNSFSFSLNSITILGAIFTLAAITGLSLDDISSAHWTAKAFFVASLIVGTFSAFFSFTIQQEIIGLHGSEDIRDWLSRPMTQAEARLLNEWLKSAQSLMNSPKSQLPITTEQTARYAALHDRLAEFNSRNRPRRASLYSAILLTTPAYLLSLAHAAFFIGLTIYMRYVYTAHLVPTLVVSAVQSPAMFYLPATMKQLESVPIKRFTRSMNEIHSMVQVHPSSPHEHDTHTVDGAVQTGPTETHNENVIPLSLHGSRRRHAHFPSNQAHAAAMDSELEETSMPPSEAQVDSTTEVQRSSTSALKPSALTPASLQDVPHLHPSADQVPPTNGFLTALERFIRAQEESIDASKALFRSYETDSRQTEYWWS